MLHLPVSDWPLLPRIPTMRSRVFVPSLGFVACYLEPWRGLTHSEHPAWAAFWTRYRFTLHRERGRESYDSVASMAIRMVQCSRDSDIELVVRTPASSLRSLPESREGRDRHHLDDLHHDVNRDPYVSPTWREVVATAVTLPTEISVGLDVHFQDYTTAIELAEKYIEFVARQLRIVSQRSSA